MSAADVGLDIIGVIACVFLLVPLIVFLGIFWVQHGRYEGKKIYAMQIFNIRAAALLPIFASFLCITVFYPFAFHAFDSVAAVLEGYCMYALFAMVVTNCGGPSSVIKFLKTSDRVLCFSFQKTNAQGCKLHFVKQ